MNLNNPPDVGQGADNFNSALWAAFLSYLYSQGKIDVPQDFRTRISAIRYILDSDVTGVINTLLDYSVNTAASTDFTIECADDTLKEILNQWLKEINLEVNGIPTGIAEFSKEYYKERWRESSFILTRVAKWKKLSVNGIEVRVPTVIWLVNSASIYVLRDKTTFTLGTDRFFLDSAHKEEMPARGEKIVIQRPFDRWWTEYATPYIVRKGIYRNYKALEMLQEKTEEVITKFIPYIYRITKGTERMYIDGKVEYSDEDLKKMQEALKEKLEQYKRQKGKTPVQVNPFDTKAEHDIPDISKVVKEELFNQGYRAILCGLGFVDVIQGISSTRKEAVLNPAPFIEEVNAGVDGFKSLLTEIIYHIITVNQIDHSKLFNRNKKFYIANTPLKINVEPILDQMRSGFVYGGVSVQTYLGALGIDYGAERERMKDEWENGDRELFYPHIVSNQEEKGIDTQVSPTVSKKQPITKKEVEKDNEKTKNPDLMYKIRAELIETNDYYRNRVEDPKSFQKDSFKTIVLSKEKGIKAIVGKKKGDSSMTVQSLLFDKEKFTQKEAEKWVKEHSDVSHASLTQDIEYAPYDKLSALPDAVQKLSEVKQRQWMHVWNDTYKKHKDEKRAFRSAWAVVHQTGEL